jgi:AbrB family looped-hinge helix DNA binding protein
MSQVTISSKYQVVIPSEIRKHLNLKAGQKMTVLAIGNHIKLVPDRDISELRGAFPGLTSEGLRDEEDRY